MKRITFFVSLFVALCAGAPVFAQFNGSFKVEGDLNKFYPVLFKDGGWNNNVATVLELGRSHTHVDGMWRGVVIARFRFHVTNWGHAGDFIDADIRQNIGDVGLPFVAGWADGSGSNDTYKIIIWLRGNTTYNYSSNYADAPVIYDGIANQLPYQEPGGVARTYKSAPEPYVNVQGISYSNTAYFNGASLNYFGGSIGLGTTNPGSHRLAVEGSIGARKLKVTQEAWADFVFDTGYKLPSLQEVEQYVKVHKHLPDVPAASEVKENGLDVGEMNKILLQKVEELTLHLIELEKNNRELNKRLQQLEKKVN